MNLEELMRHGWSNADKFYKRPPEKVNIKNINKPAAPETTKKIKIKEISEMKFLRAWYPESFPKK